MPRTRCASTASARARCRCSTCARSTASRSWPRSSTRSCRTRPARIIAERGEKAAMQPEVTMTEDEKEAEKILAGGADFEFQLAYEVIPTIEIKDFSEHRGDPPGLRRAGGGDRRAGQARRRIRRAPTSPRPARPKKATASPSTISARSTATPFDGGAGSDQPLVLGSKEFIPGFEDQLIGAKAGDEKLVTVTFPENYSAPTWPARKPPSTSPSRKSPSPANSRSTTRPPRSSASNCSSACARSCAARSRASSAR